MSAESLNCLMPPDVRRFYRLTILFCLSPTQAISRFPENRHTVWMNRVTEPATILTCFQILSFVHSFIETDFFEISAYRISKTYAVIQLPTTRYDYLRDERNHDCFYILNAGSKKEDESSFSSVIVYIARRTGRLSPEFYNYELEEH